VITAFRITKKRYARQPLAGLGGLEVGGRWHHRGTPIVYCAQSLSLATLEFFVHFGKRAESIALVSIAIDIPADLIENLAHGKLPKNWREVPVPAATADLGAQWIRSGRSAVLRVPSVLSPGECNYLINCAHPKCARIRARAPAAFSFDTRMWKY
jgi:RES domain-containing protein